MSDTTSERSNPVSRWKEKLDRMTDPHRMRVVVRIADVRTVLAEIRRLEEAVKRWKHEEETIWVPLDKKATRYREALERIRDTGRSGFTTGDGHADCLQIATRALEADKEEERSPIQVPPHTPGLSYEKQLRDEKVRLGVLPSAAPEADK